METERPVRTPELVGDSHTFRSIFQRIEQVAPTTATVLLLGETGTGKGVVAEKIHARSQRRGRFVEVNCAALPATLIESELFGRERGAFTDATTSQAGRFELAHGGTIFLDEIGELPLELQAKLLRVIQQGVVERLGSPRPIPVDVRIIAATNRNIHEEVRAGRFRQDLFYRLNVFPITLPPLRERYGDLELLTRHFVDRVSRRYNRTIHTVPADVVAELRGYGWPGNVRELEHVIERAIILSTDGVLALAEPLVDGANAAEHAVSSSRLTDVERTHILRVLRTTAWQIEGTQGAASILGVPASTLRSRMIKLGIQRDADSRNRQLRH
jgi:transcriptional regulator with GAF, ATPase, and Fis domain